MPNSSRHTLESTSRTPALSEWYLNHSEGNMGSFNEPELPLFDTEDLRLMRRKPDPIAIVEALREAERQKKKTLGHEELEATEPAQLFLPGMAELMRAMPNHIARSSLFAPVASGRKKQHDDLVLVSRSDAHIKFSGKQLDEAQADVWMQAMHEASKCALGETVVINRYSFLKAIGRQTGKYEYEWLFRSMKDLAKATIEINVRGKDGHNKVNIRVLHMIEGFDYDDSLGEYTLKIDRRWHEMYGNREFSLIDWDKRLQFGQKQNMAKALQRLLAASRDTQQHFSLDWLKAKMGYESPMRKFKETLKNAMQELGRLEIVSSWKIKETSKGNEQLTVWLADQE